MAKRVLRKETTEQITQAMEEMEKAEGEAFKDQGPVFVETMEALWYVVYKTVAE